MPNSAALTREPAARVCLDLALGALGRAQAGQGLGTGCAADPRTFAVSRAPARRVCESLAQVPHHDSSGEHGKED
jgi:hypothetical protein